MKQCIRNVVTVLENDPKFKGAIRYNMMTDRNDIVKGLGWYRESPALTDSDIDHIMLYLEEHYSLTTEKKITVIAQSSGFENVEYFCKLFKKHYQMTPTEYRRKKQLSVSRLTASKIQLSVLQ